MRIKVILIIQAAFVILNAVSSCCTYAGEAPKKLEGKLQTSDNVAIAYERYITGSDSVVVVCPGFYNSKNNRWMKKTVKAILPLYDIIIFDFRGHGESGGKYSWSAREHMDVNAVLDHAKSCGYRQIGILAYSLGAAAALNSAASRDDVDAMVLISCPTGFWQIDYDFWKPEMFSDLKDNIECHWEGKGARTDSMLIEKVKPIHAICTIKYTPILFIHGGRDWVVGEGHSKKLYAAAKVYKKLVIIKDGLHAERLLQQYPGEMRALILNWFSETFSKK